MVEDHHRSFLQTVLYLIEGIQYLIAVDPIGTFCNALYYSFIEIPFTTSTKYSLFWCFIKEASGRDSFALIFVTPRTLSNPADSQSSSTLSSQQNKYLPFSEGQKTLIF